jgi:hypothetical protein
MEGAIKAAQEHIQNVSMRNQLKEKLSQMWPKYENAVCEKIREFFDLFRDEVKKAFESSNASNNLEKSIALLDGVGQSAMSKEKIDELREKMEEAGKC